MTLCKYVRFYFKQRLNKPDCLYISCILETLDNHIYMRREKLGLCGSLGKRICCLLLQTHCGKSTSEDVHV